MSSFAVGTPPPRPRKLLRVAGAVVGIAILALALSGCVDIRSVQAIQRDSIGPVDVTVKGCVSKPAVCSLGFSQLQTSGTEPGQGLLGLQVPVAAVAPPGFTTSNGQPFTASPSYTAELTRLAPPGSGLRWVGYISDSRIYTPGADDTATISVVLPVPDGSPDSGVYPPVAFIGSRSVTQDKPATRAVTCGDNFASLADATVCRDDDWIVPVENGLPITNFAFLPPAPVSAQPGQTAIIPMTGKFVGAAKPEITFALTATTTLPGASAIPTVPTLAPPTDSTTSVAVSVPVPDSAAAGTYAVTLTGTLSSGQARSASATLIVVAPVAGGTLAGRPSLSGLVVSPATISSTRGSVPALISVTLSEPGRLRVLLERRAAGRRKAGRCVAPTSSLRHAGAARCTRFIVTSTLTRTGLGAGVARVSISGRVGGRPRAAGRYRLTVTSLSAGGITSLPLRGSLVITR